MSEGYAPHFEGMTPEGEPVQPNSSPENLAAKIRADRFFDTNEHDGMPSMFVREIVSRVDMLIKKDLQEKGVESAYQGVDFLYTFEHNEILREKLYEMKTTETWDTKLAFAKDETEYDQIFDDISTKVFIALQEVLSEPQE